MSKLTPDLSLIPRSLHAQALEALNSGDVGAFLGTASNERSIAIVARNSLALKQRRLLEAAFVDAMTATRTNNHRNYRLISLILAGVDRGRLIRAGDRLPAGDHWNVYRGVGGIGRERRIRGYSWTADVERARWFAIRAARLQLADPAVYACTVGREGVLFYSNERKEQEFFVVLTPEHRPKRLETIGGS